MGLAGWFMARFGAELLMPRTAWLTARMLQLDVQARPLPEALAFWRAAGMPAAELARRAEERPFNFSDCTMPLPPGFTRLEEGATLELAGRRWAVRFGQGHAPDHATLWSADGDLVIAGDQALPSISPNIGVHATEPGADPLDEWLRSCRRLRRHARAGQLVLCGHNLPFTGLPQRLRQLERHHHAALRGLEAYLSAPRRAAECFVPLFRREIRGGEYGLALAEAVAHLNRLERSRRDQTGTRPMRVAVEGACFAGEAAGKPGRRVKNNLAQAMPTECEPARLALIERQRKKASRSTIAEHNHGTMDTTDHNKTFGYSSSLPQRITNRIAIVVVPTYSSSSRLTARDVRPPGGQRSLAALLALHGAGGLRRYPSRRPMPEVPAFLPARRPNKLTAADDDQQFLRQRGAQAR